MDPYTTIKAGDALGECIRWDDHTESLWWTDIEGKVLHRLDWRRQEHCRFSTPERLAAFGFVEDRSALFGAFESGFGLFCPETGAVGPIVRPEGLGEGMRLNDGRVDRRGRFWVGAMVEARNLPRRASLYCVQNGSISRRERGIGISNSICWSPDAAWFYFADSLRHLVWRYSCDIATGEITGRQEFVRSSGRACPDGAAVDAEGFIWVAQWAGDRVLRYAPDGRIDRVLEVPVSQPTCVAFGGPDLDLLFVTSACVGLSPSALQAQTGAGDVFVYNVGVRGLPENRFKLDGWPGSGGTGG